MKKTRKRTKTKTNGDRLKTSRGRSTFARRFERAYRGVMLPSVYRQFIVGDSYLPYRRSFIRGLFLYDPDEAVELNLASSVLLKPDQLWDDSDIDPDDASEFHPIATLPLSSQFLAIKRTMKNAPVFLWHHETGAFHLQFRTFAGFVRRLLTPEQVRTERRVRRLASAARRRRRNRNGAN